MAPLKHAPEASKLRRGYPESAIVGTMQHDLARQALPSGRSCRLEIAKRDHDLALFNLVVDSKLHGGDLMGLKVSDSTSLTG